MKNSKIIALALSAGLVLAVGIAPSYASEEEAQLEPVVVEETTPTEVTAEEVEQPTEVETEETLETVETEVEEELEVEVTPAEEEIEVDMGAPMELTITNTGTPTEKADPAPIAPAVNKELESRRDIVNKTIDILLQVQPSHTTELNTLKNQAATATDLTKLEDIQNRLSVLTTTTEKPTTEKTTTTTPTTYAGYWYNGTYYPYYYNYYYYPSDTYKYYTVDGVTYRYYPYSDYYYTDYYRYYPYSDYYYTDYYRYYPYSDYYYTDYYRYYPYSDYYYTDYYRYYPYSDYYYTNYYRYYPYSYYDSKYYYDYLLDLPLPTIQTDEVTVGTGYTYITAGTHKRSTLESQRKDLEKSLADSQRTADGARLLMRVTPKLAQQNASKLSRLITEAETLQKEARAAIAELDAVLK